MRISLNWLTDFVDVSMPAAELGKLLTNIGLNCEEIVETPTDVVLDLEVTPNRPDLLGHLGVAREIAAATGAAFRPPVLGAVATRGRAADLTAVEVVDPDLCPRYTACVIRGVKIGPSPSWLVERLQAIGARSVNNVVDVTNYVMFEYSQPLHAFDYDKLAEHRIVVRRARAGEAIVSIDGTRCELAGSMLVIADADKPVAVAGVMGGLETEVSEVTTNVLLEAAEFSPLSIRMTSRALELMSESNYRFERGVDPVAVDAASLRACEMIVELAGGELAEGVVDVWAQPYQPPLVSLRPQRCDALLGITVAPQQQFEILERLGLAPRRQNEKIVCTIPSYRPDLRREADLIEEIARLTGYETVPVAAHVTHPVVGEAVPQRVRKELAAALASAGFDETITFSFIDEAEAALFGWQQSVRVDPTIRRSNNVLRMTLLPSLLRACKTNQTAGATDVSLFELSAVFPPGASETDLPAEYVQLGMATTRELPELRGALGAVVGRIAPDSRLEVRAKPCRGLAADATAEVLLDGEPFGVLGCAAGDVLDHYDLQHDVALAAVNFEMLLPKAGEARRYQPVPKFPAVQRDLSVIVDETLTWRELAEAIDAANQPLRVAVDYVTTYRGKPIPPGRKSVTLSVTYRCPDRTLRSEEVDEQVAELVTAVKGRFGAELRT